MSRQASSTSTPFWRSPNTLTMVLWGGVGLAPLAMAVLVIGSGDASLRLALVMGLGSVVMIGLAIVARPETETTETDLVAAMADLEEHTHHALAQMRGQLRQLADERSSRQEHVRPAPEQPRPVESVPHGGRHYEMSPPHHSPPHHTPPHYSPPRHADADYRHDDPRSGAIRSQSDHYREPAPNRMESQWNRDAGAYSGRRPEPGPAHIPRPRQPDEYTPPTEGEQRRRREAAMEETGEMVRVTESVSVTRRETTTMRPFETGSDFDEAGRGPSGYQEAPESSGRFGKLKLPKLGRDHQPAEVSAEADSLLSGLAPEPGHEDDWYARGGQSAPRDAGRAGRYVDHQRSETPAGGWRTEERSAELRMGMRQSRSAPEDGWNQRDAGHRDGGYGVEGERRAISDTEAEPVTRWSERNAAPRREASWSPRGNDGYGGSYMDRYYGER